MVQNLFKQRLCNQTPLKILNFQPQGCFWYSRPPPEGTLLEAFSVHVAIQRRPEVENCGFWGGLVAESFFERDFASFLEGSWTVKTLISHGRGSKNHNFTEVRILSLFVSILEIILGPQSL